MSSFVGDLWKKVGELKSSVSSRVNSSSSSTFPFIYDENVPIGRTGPFTRFHGQDFESFPERKETSLFRRVNVLVCKEKSNFHAAKSIIKSLKILRHPRMLKYVSSKESESELVLVTEWAEPFSSSALPSEEAWHSWGLWSVQQVSKFLSGAGKGDGSVPLNEESGNLWITAAGEIKVALFTEHNDYAQENNLMQLFPLPKGGDSVLVPLTESLDLLVTLSAGERVALIKRLLSLPAKLDRFQKFLALPELVRSRRILSSNNANSSMAPVSECSLEEAQYLFLKGCRELLIEDIADPSADFMYLLSDLYCDLLGRHGGNSVPLTLCLLDQIGNQGLGSLFTEKFAQDKIYPIVSVLLGHGLPVIREAALKALQGLCERLNVKIIGNDVLRQLARAQGDVEGPLRLKALTILSSRAVWDKLADPLKAKICGPAVSRALGDSFPPCRHSGLQLLRQGLPLLPAPEIVTNLIPALSLLFLEPDGKLRAEAFECMEKLIIPTLKRSAMSVKTAAAPTKEDGVTVKISEMKVNSPIISSTDTHHPPIEEFSNNPITTQAQAQTQAQPQPQAQPHLQRSSKLKLGTIKKIV